MPGPSGADTIDSALRRRMGPAHEVSKRVRRGRHNGPPGPVFTLEGGSFEAEQTQRGKLCPELGREVEEGRGRLKGLNEDEALDLVSVPPQKTVEYTRQLRRSAEMTQVDVTQRWGVPCFHWPLQNRKRWERVVHV